MDLSEFHSLFQQGFKKLNLTLTDEIYQNFILYLESLIDLPYNLTSIRNPKDIIIEHFFDSLSLLTIKSINLTNKKIIDIGCGAGFPLLPIKLVHQNIEPTFLDRKTKSISFLKQLTDKLNISQNTFINSNARELKSDLEYKEKFDYIVTRAVGSIDYMVKSSFFLLKPKGMIILYKGPKHKEEIDCLPSSIKKKITDIIIKKVEIPFLSKERYLIFIQK